MNRKLTHINKKGEAKMVSVKNKKETHRTATVKAEVHLSKETLKKIRENNIAKGDIFGVARSAGMMAIKKTPEYIVLCHPLRIVSSSIDFKIIEKKSIVEIECRVEAIDRTGVEMEAFTGASAAALNIYDMVKAIDRAAVISNIRLIHKSGGKSGTFDRE